MMIVRLILLIVISVVFYASAATQQQYIAMSVKSDKPRPESVLSSRVGVEGFEWRFEAEFVKPATVPYEPIEMHLKITNLSGGSRPMPQLSDLLTDISYRLYNAQGDIIPTIRWQAHLRNARDSTRRLGPGESRGVGLDLLSLVNPGEEFKSGDIQKLLPGEYSVVISLYLDPMHHIPREEYTLTLAPLLFRVVEPTGDSAKAYELFRSGQLAKMKNRESALKCFNEILTDYPDTPYDQITNHYLLLLMPYGPFFDRDRLINMRIRFLLKYPESPHNRSNVSELIPWISSERMKEVYHEIRDNPKAAPTIQYLREQHPWIFEEADK